MNIISKLESKIKEEFGEQLKKNIVFDGKVIRQDAMYFFAHEFEYKGNMSQVITAGSWKYGKEFTVKSWEDEQERDKKFLKAYKDKTVKVRAEIEVEKQKKQKQCKEKWKPIFDKSSKCETHDYLEFKGVKSYGLKVDQNDVLLVPCKDINGFTGVQRIYKDPESGKFEKRFSAGIKIQGAIHALSNLQGKEYCYLSEGYATAATIQEIFTGTPSVCCFNAGNIPRAIETIRTIYPDIRIIIAADNDHATKGNPGLKYAKQAAKRFKNCIIKYPKFKMKNSEWTDFNDLAQFESKEIAQEQLSFTEDEFSVLECLGHNNGTYFYISSENQQIVTLTWNNHNKAGLRRLFANKSFWLKNYGIEKDDQIIVAWDMACEDLMENCHKKGIFDPAQVRGIGVWKDGNKYVINDGEQVINANPSSVYNYQKTVRVDYSFVPSNPQNLLHLLEGFKSLEYKNPNDYFYLSSWYIQAHIFSVLPWRFHIWLTGSAGSGKSTILKWLGSMLINNILTNNTTSAGVRQTVKSNACSVIYDEAEATEERTKGVIALAREMSSSGDFQSLRGTVNGNSLNYNTECVFCFGSIQVNDLNQADRSRIFTIEMATTKNQSEEIFAGISERFEYFAKNKNEVFTIVYNSIDNIIHNYNFCRNNLKKDYKLESRLADQIGTAMACHFIYYSQEKMDLDQYKVMVKNFNLVDSDYTEENNEKEHESCYDALMSVIVDNYSNTTVAGAIHNIFYSNKEEFSYGFEKMLGVHGLKYFKDEKELFIANKNDHLKNKLKNYSDITRILKRDNDIIVKEKDRVRISELGNVRGIRIKVKS